MSSSGSTWINEDLVMELCGLGRLEINYVF